VPVLFSLFSWDLAVQPRVQDWLTDQLMQTYPALQAISEDAAAALVEQSRVLPVLDGLDELLPARAAAIINSLNASLPGGVILTSRRAEYLVAIATARDRLTAADDIEPLPLTTAEAAAYLRHHLQPNPEPAWDALLENLTPAAGPAPSATPALAQIVATPLGLWLVRAVYMDSHRDPAPLIAPSATPDSLREDLFAQLISALIAARPPNR
jgi:hypothetical protein